MDDSEPDDSGELPQTFLGRRKAAFFKAPARPSPISITDEETRQRITRIDDRERRWGYSAAVLAAAVAFLAELPGVLHPKTTHASVSTKPKGTTCARILLRRHNEGLLHPALRGRSGCGPCASSCSSP